MPNSKKLIEKKTKKFIDSFLTIELFTIHFGFWQVVNILIYLYSRQRENFTPLFSDQVYLGFISFSTFLLVSHLILIGFVKIRDLKNLFFIFIFVLPLIFLYLSMFLSHDFRSIQSITLLIIFIIPIVVFSLDQKLDVEAKLIKIITILSVINTLLSLTQYFGLVPVAQFNEREFLSEVIQRPTGIFFNAFAMSYASLIFLAISLSYKFNLSKNSKLVNVLMISSLLSLLLSGTRTSLWLAGLFILTTLFIQYFKMSQVSLKLNYLLIIFLGSFAPLLLLLFGLKYGNQELATLNGRTQMWECVINRWQEFFPIGIGLDDAFPPKFCAESGWFANLRHPENMFLLSYVESGIFGVLSYVVLFFATLRISYKAFLNKNILPTFLTSTFLLASLIYVPFFHYLPFLPNRPADRGIFNFHLLYLVWIIFIRISIDDLKYKKIIKIRKKR